MSLDSSFWINAPNTTPGQVQTLLLATGYFIRADDIKGNKRLFADGVILVIDARSVDRDELREAGINANIHVFFGCSDNQQTKDWTLNTVRAVMALLHAFPGDALFIYSGDSPALLRKDGNLMLDRRCGVWLPDVEPRVLPLIDLPYSWGLIPVS